ncbi:MAG: response regulator [Bdellovibrionota bacterium]
MTRVLIVDDDPFATELVARYLRPRGFTVQVAYSGSDALTAIQKVDFDLVISDVRMPYGSGIDLLRELERFPRHVPVILMSAGAKPAEMQAKAVGADAYLAKPLVKEDLEREIERLLGGPTREI